MAYVRILWISMFCFMGCVAPALSTTKSSLAIMKLVHNNGKEDTVYLANDYGFLILWYDNQEPELYLYDKPGQSILMTNDFSAFIKGLSTFPDGAKVDRLHGCSITSMGMPEKDRIVLDNLIRNKRFVLTDANDGNFPVCTCEVRELHRYTTADKSTSRVWVAGRSQGD